MGLSLIHYLIMLNQDSAYILFFHITQKAFFLSPLKESVSKIPLTELTGLRVRALCK